MRMPWKVSTAVLVLVALALSGTALAARDQVKPPSIRITSPQNGQVVKKTEVEVTVAIKNFKVDSRAVGKAPASGRGHWYLNVDGKLVDSLTKRTVKVKDLAAGEHTIEVGLHNNDHSFLSPPVSDSVKITVTPKAERTPKAKATPKA